MDDLNTRVAAKAAARRKAAEEHNAMRATMRGCRSTCPFCAAERADRERRARLPEAAPLDPQGTGTATLYDLKEAAGVQHGGFIPREVTAAPFGGTREQWHDAIDAAAAARREHRQREEEVERAKVLPLIDASGIHARGEPCIECGATAVALCDGPSFAVGAKPGATCDAPMCGAHRNPAGEDRDLCFTCMPQRSRAKTKRKRAGT